MNKVAPQLDISTTQRIWIVGPTGSGKSTLADTLGDQLNRPVAHLDEFHFEPGWVERPDHIKLRDVKAFTAAHRAWIIEGNYSAIRHHFHADIDLLIWLDFSLLTTFPRLIRRTWHRCRRGVEICNGNRETFRKALLTRDSILWWSLSTHHTRRAQLSEQTRALPTVRLSSPQEVRQFLQRNIAVA